MSLSTWELHRLSKVQHRRQAASSWANPSPGINTLPAVHTHWCPPASSSSSSTASFLPTVSRRCDAAEDTPIPLCSLSLWPWQVLRRTADGAAAEQDEHKSHNVTFGRLKKKKELLSYYFMYSTSVNRFKMCSKNKFDLFGCMNHNLFFEEKIYIMFLSRIFSMLLTVVIKISGFNSVWNKFKMNLWIFVEIWKMGPNLHRLLGAGGRGRIHPSGGSGRSHFISAQWLQQITEESQTRRVGNNVLLF